MQDRLKYFGAAVCAVTIWGFFSIPLRQIKAYPSDEILYYRIFTSLIICLVAMFSFRRKHIVNDINNIKDLSRKRRARLILLILLAGIFITGNWYTFIYTVNNVNLKSAAFAYMVCPLITAIGGFTILKERISTPKIIGILTAIISIILLSKGALMDAIWSVTIALFYAIYLIIQRVMPELDKLNLLAVQLFISSLILLPFYTSQSYDIIYDGYFWWHIVLIAVVFTIIPLFLSLYALIDIPSSTMGIIIYINPIIAFLVAVFYFDEHITIHQALAYGLLFCAVFIFNWEIIRSIIFKTVNRV